MSQLTKFKQTRARIKGQVTRIANTIDAQTSIAEAKVKLKRLEEIWTAFENIQADIEDKEPADENLVQQFLTECENERTFFEERYFEAAAKTQAIIDTEQQNLRQLRQTDNQDHDQVREQHSKKKTKLPEIKLPEFNGEYTKWIFFKNSFETTIHMDNDLSPIQKHQYLIGTLQGDARKVIEGFTISAENYENAWQLLKDTYDNQMMIIETHLDELINFPSISKENKADSLRQLMWHIQTHVSSLKALSQPVEHWDILIIHLARKKLDFAEQREWQDKIKECTPQTMPTLTEFMKFLTERCHTLRMLNQSKPKLTNTKQLPYKEKRSDKKVVLASTSQVCKLCKGDHPIFKCEELLQRSPEDRKKLLIEKKHCINCLQLGHFAKECRGSKCRKCGGRHNTLIHKNEASKEEGNTDQTATVVNHCVKSKDSDTVAYISRKHESQVILSTALVYVKDADGKRIVCRALLDSGSQSNLITIDLFRKLKLIYTDGSMPVSGVGRMKTEAKKITQIHLESMHTEFTAEIECLVLPSITTKLPQVKINTERILIPTNILLADPTYDEPGDIDLLIGAGLYWKMLVGSSRNRIDGQPALQNTRLGWIIGGETFEGTLKPASTCLTVTNPQLSQQLERFWKQETLPEVQHYTKEEKLCEKQFSETVQRDSKGRFIVRLPTRSNISLGQSREQAQHRLEILEKRFAKHPEIRKAYCEFLDEYEKLGHMSLVEDSEPLNSKGVYFIPHQAVIRPDSITTKIRVVFDASAKTTQGTSLNDKLMAGPNLQKDLFQIILRFRSHEYVITSDIEKMFRQILIHPEDRTLQRILWRMDSKQDIRMYQLNTVTYGTASAPFHAMRCLQELAAIYEEKYPLAARVIKEDFYMDDVLTGGKTIQEVIQLQQQLSRLLIQGQFLLRKWRANDPRILQHLVDQHKTNDLFIIDKEEALKTLGLFWNSKQDSLQYHVELLNSPINSKREVLSRISQIFDPLGLVGPVLIKGKIFMQQLWSAEVEWDQPLSQEHMTIWNTYYSSLPQLNDLRVQRNINPHNHGNEFNLLGFSDASERAFGACLYAVSKDENGVIQSHLLCSKSKVAPLKTWTIPRLELEAALLLSQLYNGVRTAFKERLDQVRFWSDSTIVLGWIKTEPHLLKTFVANRVAKIQEITEGAIWQHVASEDNPADLLSRGISVADLKISDLWWYGPSWIRTQESQPECSAQPETNLPELKSITVALVAVNNLEILQRYSSFSKLCRVVAYCHCFINNLRSKRKIGTLEVTETQQAEKTIIKWVQSEDFLQEFRCLRTNQELPRKSPLKSLRPFLDNDGLMRVGGRLNNAELSEDQKHPLVMPAKHYITHLIMREEHNRMRHCPPEQLLHNIRQKFWPISGRREAQRVVKKCLKCFRFNPTIPDVLMGDLPKERVMMHTRPFTVTGVDYAGPIQIRESKRRGKSYISKGYVAVFTCFSTKAVHLELVSDLTTEAYLATLRRFTARRGLCSQIFSDNGTSFVGAARTLQEIQEFLQKATPEIASFLAKQQIVWQFIPPRSPHFGGLWEAAVKIMKRHLYTETQGRTLLYEEYQTLLCDIEAILNSRPLTPLTNDPSDLQVLTPAHFILGESLIQPAEHSYNLIPDNRLSRWQHLQKIRQQLWLRWQREYLQELQRRTKWNTPGRRIELNTLVLLIEDHVSPLRWPLGRVIQVYPGSDGEIRVVMVKTQSGTYKRSVKKLCPLPISAYEEA